MSFGKTIGTKHTPSRAAVEVAARTILIVLSVAFMADRRHIRTM